MKKYNLLVGVILSFFIGILASIPRLIRFELSGYQNIAGNITYTFCYAMFCWFCHHYFIHSRFHSLPFSINWFKHGFSIMFCIALSLFYNQVVAPSIGLSIMADYFEMQPTTSMLLFRGTLMSGFLFFVVYYLHILTTTQQSKVENERLKKENLQARLDSVKQQISPHFLFNTLSTLSSMTKEEKVKNYIAELSNVYRYLLQVRENDFVTVSEELAFVWSYLYIIKERFENGLDMRIDIDETARHSRLPPLAVQMLVENALKHNIVSSAKPLFIEIITVDGHIIVRNNYQPKPVSEPSTGHGLPNIQERYQLLANASIEIEKGENYFSVKLPILA